MPATLSRALERAWYRPPRWTLLLLPLEWLFIGITALRRSLYRRGALRSYRAGCMVVVVGNLSVGGTGKTPAVIALARALKSRKHRVAIVSRGYGGRESATPRRVEAGVSVASEVGDEALLMAEAVDVPVVVCTDRVAAVQLLEAEGTDIVVCDDGLQHYALQRDFEIVTLDSARRYGNGHRLPVGPLREPPQRLATVDWVLERGGADPFSACPLRPVAFQRLGGGAERECVAPDSATIPRRVNAIAAIGNPEAFFATLRELGLEVEPHVFPDHHLYSAADLAPFADRTLLMTAKDAVKCRAFAGPEHWVLQVEADLPAGLVDAVEARAEQRRAAVP